MPADALLCRCVKTSLLFALLLPAIAAPARAAIEDQGLSRPVPAPPAAPVLTRPPVLRTPAQAVYPTSLFAQNIAGEAVLVVDIDAEGAVDRVEVQSSTHPDFGIAALDAGAALAFTPALIDNVPGAIRIEYRYTFAPQVAPPPATPAVAEAPINFTGLVREAGTRLPVVGAVISLAGKPVGETDSRGEFALRGVAPGALAVRISSATYEPYEVLEELRGSERLEAKYYLVRRNKNPYETVVRSRLEKREVAKVQLSRQELEKIPGTFGDPVRVIENLPGMARAPGGLGGALIVRGANPSNSSVYLDGVQIPLLYHFFGLTSVINAAFLERIDFYPGGFGARYGRATAGIVDITSRDLDCNLWHGTGKVDVIDSAAYTCVPAGTWNVAAAARRSYVDLILPSVLARLPRGKDEGYIGVSPVYWDYQMKAHTVLGSHALSIFAFGSNDDLRVFQTGSLESVNFDLGLHQAFHRLQLKDRWRLGAETTLTSSVSPGYDVQNFSNQVSEQQASFTAGTYYYSIDWREDFTTRLLPEVTLNGGLDHRMGTAHVNLMIPVPTQGRTFPSPTFDYGATQPYKATPSAFNQAYWGELVIAPYAGLKLIPGVRIERASIVEAHDLAVLPRATARLDVVPGTTLKAAYGLYNQMPEPRYILPSLGNPTLSPERANQFVVGYEQDFPNAVSLDFQLFYTLRKNLVAGSRSVYASKGTRTPEVWANTGVGRSYGLEVLLRRTPTAEGMFYGWIAYTLSRSMHRDHPVGSTYFEERADGQRLETPYTARDTQEMLSAFDQTHILTVVAQWTLPGDIDAGFRFRLVSGNPYTPQEGGRIYVDLDRDRYQNDLTDVPRNSGRMPLFSQLDIRVEKTFVFDLWKLTPYLELLNATNRRNPESYSYDYRWRQRVTASLLPLVPVLGVKGEF